MEKVTSKLSNFNAESFAKKIKNTTFVVLKRVEKAVKLLSKSCLM